MPCFYHLDVEISMVGNLRVQTGDNMKSSILSSYHPIILSYHAKNPSLKSQSAKIASSIFRTMMTVHHLTLAQLPAGVNGTRVSRSGENLSVKER